MIYAAFNHITSGCSSDGTLIDADTDLDALRSRVNAYFATPKMVDYYRRVKMEIPEGQLESPHYANYGEGGYYSTWLTIKEVKPLGVCRDIEHDKEVEVF